MSNKTKYAKPGDTGTATEDGRTLKWKVLKRGIKFTFRERMVSGTVKLTMPQWELANRETIKDRSNLIGAPAVKHLPCFLGHGNMDVLLRDQGLTYLHRYYYFSRGSHTKSLSTYSNALTECGLFVFQNLPVCPPRTQWPQAPASAVLSRDNIKLSRPQKEMLQKWAKVKPTSGVPINGEVNEMSKWVSDGHFPRASISCLMRMELVEPGIRGLTLADGKMTLNSEKCPSVELVYRLTVLGALVAGND